MPVIVSVAPAARCAALQSMLWPLVFVQSSWPLAAFVRCSRESTRSVTSRLSARETPAFLTEIVNVWPLVPASTVPSAKSFDTWSTTFLTTSTDAVLLSTPAVFSSDETCPVFCTVSASVVVSTWKLTVTVSVWPSARVPSEQSTLWSALAPQSNEPPGTTESTIRSLGTLSVRWTLSAVETPLFVTASVNELAVPPAVTCGSVNVLTAESCTSLTIWTLSEPVAGVVTSADVADAVLPTLAAACVSGATW